MARRTSLLCALLALFAGALAAQAAPVAWGETVLDLWLRNGQPAPYACGAVAPSTHCKLVLP